MVGARLRFYFFRKRINDYIILGKPRKRLYYLGQIEAMGLLSNVEYFLKCGEKQCRLTFERIYAIIPNKSQPKRRWVHEEYKPTNYGKNKRE